MDWRRRLNEARVKVGLSPIKGIRCDGRIIGASLSDIDDEVDARIAEQTARKSAFFQAEIERRLRRKGRMKR